MVTELMCVSAVASEHTYCDCDWKTLMWANFDLYWRFDNSSDCYMRRKSDFIEWHLMQNRDSRSESADDEYDPIQLARETAMIAPKPRRWIIEVLVEVACLASRISSISIQQTRDKLKYQKLWHAAIKHRTARIDIQIRILQYEIRI